MSEESKKGDWYAGGKGFDTEFDKPVRNESAGIRYWMPKETERRIIFLTGEPEVIMFEHSMKIGSSYRNYATCLSHLGKPCPLCDLGVGRYQAAVFTVIDTNKYTDKAGKEHKNERRLLIAKNATWEKLVRQHKKRVDKGESLKGACYSVFRGADSKSPSVGDTFEFEGMVDEGTMSKFPCLDEFDYAELLKPNPDLVEQYVRKLKAQGTIGGEAEKPRY